MGACKPGTPSEFIQPDDMEDILVDYHLARAMAEQDGGPYEETNYRQALYIEAVLQKYGYTKSEFDSSLVYYYKRADRFVDIYEHVAERLEEQALLLGATEGEIGKYASLNANGDTANIWSDRTSLAMMPLPPYNRWDFKVAVDSIFKMGDSFLMQKDGKRHKKPYGKNRNRAEGIKGFFYLGDGSHRTTTTRLLFLSNIQFIRFHKKQEEKQEVENMLFDESNDEKQKDSVAPGIDRERLSPRIMRR